METHYYVVALISQNASARCETHQAFLGGAAVVAAALAWVLPRLF